MYTYPLCTLAPSHSCCVLSECNELCIWVFGVFKEDKIESIIIVK